MTRMMLADYMPWIGLAIALLLVLLLLAAVVGLRLLRLALLALTQISVAERQSLKKISVIHDEIEKLRRGR